FRGISHLGFRNESASHIVDVVILDIAVVETKRRSSMAVRQTEHGTEEVARETTRKATEQATKSAREMSDAAERAARMGAETVQRNSEQLLNSWRTSADAANQIAERSLDKWSKMFGFTGDTATQAMQQSFGNTQALLETTTMFADGMRHLSDEWMRFLQE